MWLKKLMARLGYVPKADYDAIRKENGMRLTVEWLDEHEQVLVNYVSRCRIEMGDTFMVSPVIPDVRCEIEGPLLTNLARKKLCGDNKEVIQKFRDSIKSFRIRIEAY